MKSYIKILIVFLIINCQFSIINYAQVGINTDGTDPDASAMMDIKSTDKGMLIPRMTTSQRDNIGSPATGLLVFDNTTNSFWFFDGTNWVEIVKNTNTVTVNDGIALSDTCFVRKDTVYTIYNHVNPPAINSRSTGWQSFLYTGTAEQLQSIEVRMAGNYSNLQLSIYDSEGTGGTLLYTAPLSVSNGWNTIDVSSGNISLTNNQKYTVSITANSGTYKWHYAQETGSTPAVNGRADTHDDNDYYLKAYAADCKDIQIIAPNNDGQTVTLNNVQNIYNADGTPFAPIGLSDADGDTKIQVEESADEDIIRFDIGGSEILTLQRVGANNDILQFLPSNNIAVGSGTLSNTSGNSNIALGSSALTNNVGGHSNIALGSTAFENNNSGNYNIGLGIGVGSYQTGGNHNILLGGNAGNGNGSHSKSNNVMIGYLAGGLNEGDANVFLGNQAGYNETGSNKLYIENSNSSSPLIYGEFDNDLLRINGTLNINNAFSFPTADGTANQILQTDGSGSLSWKTVNDLISINNFSISDTCTETLAVGTTHQGPVDNSTSQAWQSFTYSFSDAFFSQIDILFNKQLSNGTLSIYQGQGTGGTLVHQMPVSFQSAGWKTIYLPSNQVPLVQNQIYTVELSVSSGSFEWAFDQTNPYSGGVGNQSSSMDYIFRLYTKRYCGDFSLFTTNSTGSATNLNLIDTLHFSDGNFLTGSDGYSFINDADNDTKIRVEASADEDIIRFDVKGSEGMAIQRVGSDNHMQLSFPNNKSNIYIGDGTGVSASNTADRNITLGDNAFSNKGGGDDNLGIGYAVGQNQSGGSSNILIGKETGAGTNLHAKNNNVMIGNQAGKTNEGNANIFLGNEAGLNETGSNKLYIENSNSASPLIYGEFDNDLLRINGTLNINSAFSFPTADGTNGQVLQTNGSGVLTWTTLTNGGNQDLSLSNNTLSLTNDATTVDLSGYVNTDNQDLSFSNHTLSITNGVTNIDLSAYANENTTLLQDADNDTKIQVEEGTNDNIIRFDLAGTEYMTLSGQGILGFENTNSSIFIGKNTAINVNDTASSNIFIGERAGKETISGSINIFLGLDAGGLNRRGARNILIGQGAGQGNALHDKSDNIMIGLNAGAWNHGDKNTFIGNGSGIFNTGSNNVFLGNDAGKNASGSNKLYIDNSSTNSPLIYGEFDNDLLRINGTLNINNAFSLPTADGTNGQVLQTDGSGNATWTTLTDSDNQDLTLSNDVLSLTNDASTVDLSIYDNSKTTIVQDADNDTKIQVEESSNENIIRFDLAGSEIFRISDNAGGFTMFENPNGGTTTLFGLNAGMSLNSSSQYNTFIGTNAGRDNTAAFSNTFVGRDAGKLSNANYNTFIGERAGSSNVSGTKNVYLGVAAGLNNTSSSNTFIGYTSGNNNVNGHGNIFLGYQAGANETGSDKLYIENSNSTTPLIYGEFNNNLVRINGTLNINSAFSFPTADGTNGQVLQTDGSGSLAWIDIDKTTLQDADNNTKIQVEESTNENKIRFDINGDEHYRMEATTFSLMPQLAGSSFDVDFVGAGGDVNSIENSLPLGFGGVSNADYKMTFKAKGNKALELSGDKTVKVSDSYTLPNTTGSANQVLTTNGSGAATWESKGNFSENIQLNGNHLSNDGGNEGISIDNDGNATVSGNTTVNGTLQVGTSTPITGIIKVAIQYNVPNVNESGTENVDFNVPGAQVGGVVYISPRQNIGGKIVIAQAWVTGANTVRVRFRNVGSAADNPPNMYYDIVVIQ